MNTVEILPPPATTARLQGVCPLPHLGIIQVQGVDAATFIHGQLSQDFALLGTDQARLAAYCSAQGRMLASFIGFKRSAEHILLICHADLLTSTLKRLSMFVLRAKAQLSDVSTQYQIVGLAGDSVLGTATPAWDLHSDGDACCINLYPAHATARQLWVAPPGLPLPAGPVLPLADWLWGEVHSGVATLSAAVAQAFVPQMINYESVGGVNFKKGCYPGQEVVARSQFRGTLKRRAYLVHAASALGVGDEIFSAADSTQPVGTVVQAAATDGGFDAIASLQTSAADHGVLCTAAPANSPIQLFALPYSLLSDI